ncbi:hemolysin III family protein [Candidatus Latescibacterota bacterium]
MGRCHCDGPFVPPLKGQYLTMAGSASSPRYSPREEIANSVIHGVGGLLAMGGSGVLITLATRRGDTWHIVSCAIYGTTLVLLYLSSTLYHAVTSPRAKETLRGIDHSSIFLLIAGTYTPFTLVTLRGPWGWSLLAVVWGIAALGVAFQVTLLRRRAILSVGLYIAMGWAVVVAIRPMLAAVPTEGVVLLLVGGLAYTGGVGFYVWRRLPYHHAVWHLFVLAGSACHFAAVLRSVIPSS